jgi:hypothetical protein
LDQKEGAARPAAGHDRFTATGGHDHHADCHHRIVGRIPSGRNAGEKWTASQDQRHPEPKKAQMAPPRHLLVAASS